MALSYYTEGEAPKDFHITSSETDGPYKKCVLCYTVKRNFYCADCVRAGNFVYSSMPYADRYSEKQGKLLRLKMNRKHVLDRCEKLLAHKLKKDLLLNEINQTRDKLYLLKLAINQRKESINETKKTLTHLNQYNNELRLKLPRYQKRVASLGKHSQDQKMELENKISTYNDQAHSLAALRRSRIRQLTKYIFPLYISYDTSDSIEDLEFVGDDVEEEPPKREQLHIVAPWISADGDLADVQTWMSMNKEAAGAGSAAGAGQAGRRTAAALGLAAQLAALLAWTLDARLPHPLALTEYCNSRTSSAGLAWRARRLCACAAALWLRAARAPPAPPAPRAPPALAALHDIALAAASDDPALGRVESWMSGSVCEWGSAWEAGAAWAAGAAEPDPDAADPPEHLHWPEPAELEELECSPPSAPAPSLVTSAAASLASMWRGWTK